MATLYLVILCSIQQWLICEDSTCAYRTRNITKVNKHLEPECPSCKRNILIQEVSLNEMNKSKSKIERAKLDLELSADGLFFDEIKVVSCDH